MFFDSWDVLGRTLAVGFFVYFALVALLRFSGKRTLSKWNAFDLIVTVALGSSLATAILSQDIAIAQTAAAFVILIALQFLVTWLSVRSEVLQRFIKAKPSLLLYRGQFIQDTMKQERVSESEVRAALRGHGIASVESVDAVVLETDGRFSVIKDLGELPASSLIDVAGFEASRPD